MRNMRTVEIKAFVPARDFALSALSFEEYRDALLSMYREMPHEDASGDAGPLQARQTLVHWPWHLEHKTMSGIICFLRVISS
jgi:hypothetical protein